MKLDYSKYTLKELREARSSIDEEVYPDRVAELDKLLLEKANSPEEIERANVQYEKDKYSTFWLRFFASIIDGIVLSIFSAILIFVGSNGSGIIQTVVEYIDYVQYTIYSVLLHGLYGQTFGKMAVEVKVVDVKSEESINFKQAFLRDCVPILFLVLMLLASFFIPDEASASDYPGWAAYVLLGFSVSLMGWHLLEIITMLFNEKRRALHDFIAGTVVIRTYQGIESGNLNENAVETRSSNGGI